MERDVTDVENQYEFVKSAMIVFVAIINFRFALADLFLDRFPCTAS